MTVVEERVASHYSSRTGSHYERITAALVELGVDLDAATPADLKPVDEFHTGGVEATDALLDQLNVAAGTRVLDIGSGLGGTARHVAGRYGCAVTGVDLTPEFVETARSLSRLVGLEDGTRFEVGSALALPVPDDGFDVALLLHVGMNIADKPALFREVRRVLQPGGTFAVFDVMLGAETGDLSFPVPWSEVAETSFVAAPQDYRDAASAAGFEAVGERDRSAFASDFFARVRAKIAELGEPPPLGIHLLMGDTAKDKIENYVAMLEAGRIAPTEMIFRAAA